MPDALQSILTQAGLALAPLRAIKTPAQAVVFFRKLGYEIPPGAFGGALSGLGTQAGELVNSVEQLLNASGELNVVAAMANLFGRLVATGQAINQLHTQIQSGGGGALPNIGDLPTRLTNFLILDHLDRLRPEAHETLFTLGLIEHEESPAPGQAARVINWSRFGQILTQPRQLFNDVYQWETNFDSQKFLSRLDGPLKQVGHGGNNIRLTAHVQQLNGNRLAQPPAQAQHSPYWRRRPPSARSGAARVEMRRGLRQLLVRPRARCGSAN